MAGTTLGFLKFVLGFDTIAYKKGMSQAERELVGFQKNMKKAGQGLQNLGQSMALAISAPLAGLAVLGIKAAANFETSMNDVQIATKATASEFKAMRELALEIGESTTKSATESAKAMDTLAKAGVSTTDILGGAAKATVALAEATGSDLEPAAAAITDTLKLFGKTTGDLPQVINQITGAVNKSKFDFADYQLAMSQAGGSAAAAGVEFEEFATVLAATSSQFASGSDAGTSFKAFLQSLTVDTKPAIKAAASLGLQFYTAAGQLKPMAEIAEELRLKLGKLSEEQRANILEKIFGRDASRTAIGLMAEGSAGLARMAEEIRKTDAAAQSAQRMKGFNAQIEELKGKLETLAIRIADSGLLRIIGELVDKVANFVSQLSKLDKEQLKWIVTIGAVVIALGPLLIAVGGFMKLIAPVKTVALFAAGLFSVGTGGTAAAVGARAAGAGVRAFFVALGPIGWAFIAIEAVYTAWKNWDTIGPMLDKIGKAMERNLGKNFQTQMDGVKAKLNEGKQFFIDWGNWLILRSFIPDVIDAIGVQFERLDEAINAPTKKALTKNQEAYREWQGKLKDLLAELFPDVAAYNEFLAKEALIAEALKRHELTAREAAAAQQALNQSMGPGEEALDLSGFPSEPDTSDMERAYDIVIAKDEKLANQTILTTEQIIEGWGAMAVGVIGSARNISDALKSGDILGGIEQFLNMLLNVLSMMQRLGVIGTPAGTTNAGTVPLAGGGSAHAGRSYLVGEKGPELFTPRRSGYVHPSGSMGQARVMIVPSRYFDAVVDRRAAGVAAPMAGQAAVMGMAGSESRLARRQRRALP